MTYLSFCTSDLLDDLHGNVYKYGVYSKSKDTAFEHGIIKCTNVCFFFFFLPFWYTIHRTYYDPSLYNRNRKAKLRSAFLSFCI